METNVYQTPSAEILDREHSSTDFYVVSPVKFWTLFLTTAGLYHLFWFYQNWHLHRAKTGDNVMPLARAIFSIFFCHSLFRHIDNKLGQNNLSLHWRPRVIATLYVLFTIVQTSLERLSEKSIGAPYLDFLSIAFLPIVGWVLYKAQMAANLACGDQFGSSNNHFTVSTYLCIIFGLVLWGLILIGFYELIFATSQ